MLLKQLDQLAKFDFSSKEIEIYDQLIAHPGMSASELARQVGVSRENVHYYLKRLLKKAVISSRQSKGKNIYMPLGGKHVQAYIDTFAQDVSSSAAELTNFLKQLDSKVLGVEHIVTTARFQLDNDQSPTPPLPALRQHSELCGVLHPDTAITFARVIQAWKERCFGNIVYVKTVILDLPPSTATAPASDGEEIRYLPDQLSGVAFDLHFEFVKHGFFVNDEYCLELVSSPTRVISITRDKHRAELYRQLFDVYWNNS
jgi:DNA-binding CsgD family transcriptional regulator